jgi:formylglycine-generating enzyme required for sulfatase activity
MALIPGGAITFGGKTQGATDSYPPRPARTVTVATFCLDRTEVTTGAYKACASCTPTRVVIDPRWWQAYSPNEPMPPEPQGRDDFCNQHKKAKDDHPINCTTWDQAVAYCASLGRRLPTDEEWEYAARGGAEHRAYSWGSQQPSWEQPLRLCWWRVKEPSFMNIPEDQQGTCPVKSYAAGAFGLFDMDGNVEEWTSTPHVCTSLDDSLHDCFDPYVTRGSGWRTTATKDLGGGRWWKGGRRMAGDALGFRCAKS